MPRISLIGIAANVEEGECRPIVSIDRTMDIVFKAALILVDRSFFEEITATSAAGRIYDDWSSPSGDVPRRTRHSWQGHEGIKRLDNRHESAVKSNIIQTAKGNK